MDFLKDILWITEPDADTVEAYLSTTQHIHCFLNRYSYCILHSVSEIGGLVYVCKHDSDHKVTSNTL